jgi:hypothetical protein
MDLGAENMKSKDTMEEILNTLADIILQYINDSKDKVIDVSSSET